MLKIGKQPGTGGGGQWDPIPPIGRSNDDTLGKAFTARRRYRSLVMELDLITTTTVDTGDNMKRYRAAGIPDLFKLPRDQANDSLCPAFAADYS